MSTYEARALATLNHSKIAQILGGQIEALDLASGKPIPTALICHRPASA
jgi:hypothetical protein